MDRFPYFSADELACRCGCGRGQADMDPTFMAKVVQMREQLGFPFPVTSAFRCPEHNQRVSSTGLNGPHTTGHALDIALFGDQALVFVHAAQVHGLTGVGLKQHGTHADRFVHCDDLPNGPGQPRPWVWTYS